MDLRTARCRAKLRDTCATVMSTTLLGCIGIVAGCNGQTASSPTGAPTPGPIADPATHLIGHMEDFAGESPLDVPLGEPGPWIYPPGVSPEDFAEPRELHARALRETQWQEVTDGGGFRGVRFLETAVVFELADRNEAGFAADYSATDTTCLGYPMCVLTVTPTGELAPFFFAFIDDLLIHVDCLNQQNLGDELWAEQRLQIVEEQEANLVFATDETICFNALRVPYRQVRARLQTEE